MAIKKVIKYTSIGSIDYIAWVDEPDEVIEQPKTEKPIKKGAKKNVR